MTRQTVDQLVLADGADVIAIGPDAAIAGGSRGGDYLDSIGITDLAALNKEQFRTFCMEVISGALISAVSKFQGDRVPF